MLRHGDDFYYSPTYGELTLEKVKKRVLTFMEDQPEEKYRLVIGADSCQKKDGVDYVVAIVVHRIGYGGIYFWQRTIEEKKYHLRERIYKEASIALETANKFLATFKGNGISSYEVEIHVDVGKVGETRDMILEVVGMVRGSGYNCKIKPESYGASKIADRHT